MDSYKDKIRAWFLKQYRYFFVPIINSYPVPKGNVLYEYDLVTGDIHKAEYHIVNKHRMLIKKPNCIYDYAPSLHEVKPKFQTLIDKSLRRI
jgi:hypothetical protein